MFSAVPAAMASHIVFIFSSIAKRSAKALLRTSLIVIPFVRTACWSRYPTFTFLAHSTFPSSGMSFPVIMLIKVDFPSPLAPISPMCSPFKSLKDTSLKIALSPKPWLKCSTFSILIFFPFPFFYYSSLILHCKSTLCSIHNFFLFVYMLNVHFTLLWAAIVNLVQVLG